MLIKKKKIWVGVFLLVCILAFFTPRIKKAIEWDIANTVIASGAFPCEIGMNGPVALPCFTTGNPPICVPGPMCLLKDPATCSLYSSVTGLYAGGCPAPTGALFTKTSLLMAGVTPAGGLIAGCVSPAFCDLGPLAGPGGCSNCFVKSNLKIYAKKKVDFIIAGIKNLIK